MKWHSLNKAVEILDAQLGIKDSATIKKFINRKQRPSLKAVVSEGGKSRRYRIKEEWLLKFINEYENSRSV